MFLKMYRLVYQFFILPGTQEPTIFPLPALPAWRYMFYHVSRLIFLWTNKQNVIEWKKCLKPGTSGAGASTKKPIILKEVPYGKP